MKAQGTQTVYVIEEALGRQQEARFSLGIAIHLLYALSLRG